MKNRLLMPIIAGIAAIGFAQGSSIKTCIGVATGA